MTGKRHDFEVDYRAADDADGRITAVDVGFAMARCGYSPRSVVVDQRPHHVPRRQRLFLSAGRTSGRGG
jgi:xanthine dehydrogenase molybdopterin-binding subunit B